MRHRLFRPASVLFRFSVILISLPASPSQAALSEVRHRLPVTRVSAFGPDAGASIDDEPDDRLSAEDQRMVHELTERGMPEVVEALLADHPRMHRVYVARAYATAAVDTEDPTLRERFFEKAAETYRSVIALGEDAAWLRGLRRSFAVTQWQVELADLILRYWIAPDLDRFEITSGLDFDRARLTGLLRVAQESYTAAEPALDTLLVGLRTEEELFLLLGLGEKVSDLHVYHRLNSGWAAAYLAMISERDTEERTSLLEEALAAFDTVARTAKEIDRKYLGLLGAGVALRELDRFAEAEAALARVRDSTASMGVTARARFEQAKLRMASGRFAAAREVLTDLSALPARTSKGADDGTRFYARLAPVIHAYTYALEAGRVRGGLGRREGLRERAVSELEAVSLRGGLWPEVVQVYLDDILGTKRPLKDLTSLELHNRAGRLMAKQDYVQAIQALEMVLSRPDGGAFRTEARFNLGVCRFHQQDLRGAAELFLQIAREGGAHDASTKAAGYAYRCWRQVARDGQDVEDYGRLAEAAELFVATSTDRTEAAEAAWVGALARQEAGDYRQALAVYTRLTPTSPYYWQARRNGARCKERLFQSLPDDTLNSRRSNTGLDAVAAWVKLAEDLEAAAPERATGAPRSGDLPGVGSPQEYAEWATDARLSAAELLADGHLRAYERSLSMLDKMTSSPRVLALRIRCYWGFGDLEQANKVLDDYLEAARGQDVGAVLVGLSAEMEAEVIRLQEAGYTERAVQTAEASVSTIRHLLAWIESQPANAERAPVVRLSLANALARAKRDDEALALLERLMADDPENGTTLRRTALLQEELGEKRVGTARKAARESARSLWAKLLRDPTLRERAPAEYWEARYYWLRHQLRQGYAAEVVKGVQTERVWHPELGGPPWQARLLGLLEQARASDGNEEP